MQSNHPIQDLSGALLIDKPVGITSFGVVDELKRAMRIQSGLKNRDLPKIGHGGTLDPFATGLLVVLLGRAVKLAEYFLGSDKGYEGVIKFGETTIPGDPTDPVSERSDVIPRASDSLADLQASAKMLTLQPYLQVPPMHSAKKHQGKPLYELARQGLEIEREPKVCTLRSFSILDYTPPLAPFRLKCTSGTYVRVLAQDFGRLQGSVALLQSLRRISSGAFQIERAWTLDQVLNHQKNWSELPCFVPFDELLLDLGPGFGKCEATRDEARAIFQGRQNVLLPILQRSGNLTSERDCQRLAIYCDRALVAVLKRQAQVGWALEKVFI